jgi:hypothetical protein
MRRKLQAISDLVTAQLIVTHGKINLMCRQGAFHLVRAAKKEGITLRRAVGFFGGAVHHWTVAEDQTIIDPTGAQFVHGRNGVIPTDDPLWCSYDEIDPEYVERVSRYASAMQYWKWQEIKAALRIGLGFHSIEQEEADEIRTNHLGLPYRFIRIGYITWFTGETMPKLSSVTIMSTKKENMVDVLVHFKKRAETGAIQHWHEKILGINQGGRYVFYKKVKGKLIPTDLYGYDFWLSNEVSNINLTTMEGGD